jgi:hypothetical protein
MGVYKRKKNNLEIGRYIGGRRCDPNRSEPGIALFLLRFLPSPLRLKTFCVSLPLLGGLMAACFHSLPSAPSQLFQLHEKI